ncbi:PAS domain-containing sensor histidine kinase [Thauera linaloolentis]|uniref:Oxygen sensor histidine kinase NreB n=1 Tax=Thauera linaloolentis (strain DSM 12138 / JCM 21573 / CCUG 41526 / CIP 105981 / IAM 15112 / NBRC 102519 / 47Lol) TaxID=1123367 RepID=N6Z0Z4_THAL4|nr:sensor histidine kinase [Thauera linaloolentis]ENO85834.1 PAS/PAC sensor signal transduction histidine kinase [Thauera linaloolentis 47Lol = DSM 12138]MCM8567407.1 ATP-binding protein [Thauera linaloolentis]
MSTHSVPFEQAPPGPAPYDAESALADVERRLAATQALARVGDWTLERDTARVTWSPELFRLFERPVEHGAPDINEALAYLSPESLELTRTAFWYAIDKGERCTLEQTARLPSGTTAHYVTEIMPVADAGGRVFMLYGTVQDITERKALEAERLRQLARVAELSRRLLDVGERERRQLAAALHDRASPNLAALKLIFTSLRNALPATIRGELEPLLDDAAALLADTDAGIRDICATLRPATLDYAGLAAAIREYADLVARHSDTRVQLHVDEDMNGLPAELQTLLFRIAQEALANCAKHASADRIRIELRRSGKYVTLRIADDGRGFDPERLGQAGVTPGLGLITMRERAELAGGRFTLRTAPGAGTEIEVELAPNSHRFRGNPQ